MKIFQSKDFYASAYLIAKGHLLSDYQRQRGYTEFFFEETEQLKKLVKEYYSLQASIEPTRYAHSIRALKGICHSLSTSTSNQEQSSEIINKQKKGSR